MGSPEGFSSSDFDAEARRDPEVDNLLEFLGIYKQVQELMAWLVEASANADFTVKAMRRVRLHQLMQQLGIDPESPDTLNQLEAIKLDLTDRTQHPKPRVDVPEVGFFKSRIKEIIGEYEKFGAPSAISDACAGVATIEDVAQFGHTDWRSVQSRAGKGQDVSEWIHGVARIMADPVAYHAEFAGLGINSAHRAADHLAIAEDWSIRNGRHRSLAVRSLGETYVAEAGMAQWIPVAVEQP